MYYYTNKHDLLRLEQPLRQRCKVATIRYKSSKNLAANKEYYMSSFYKHKEKTARSNVEKDNIS